MGYDFIIFTNFDWWVNEFWFNCQLSPMLSLIFTKTFHLEEKYNQDQLIIIKSLVLGEVSEVTLEICASVLLCVPCDSCRTEFLSQSPFEIWLNLSFSWFFSWLRCLVLILLMKINKLVLESCICLLPSTCKYS